MILLKVNTYVPHYKVILAHISYRYYIEVKTNRYSFICDFQSPIPSERNGIACYRNGDIPYLIRVINYLYFMEAVISK